MVDDIDFKSWLLINIKSAIMINKFDIIKYWKVLIGLIKFENKGWKKIVLKSKGPLSAPKLKEKVKIKGNIYLLNNFGRINKYIFKVDKINIDIIIKKNGTEKPDIMNWPNDRATKIKYKVVLKFLKDTNSGLIFIIITYFILEMTNLAKFLLPTLSDLTFFIPAFLIFLASFGWFRIKWIFFLV